MNEYILKYQGKELKMPQWGDMNDFIMIRTQYDLQILPLSIGIGNRAYCGTPLGRNTTHELNTKFNGLFKDCIYGDGDDIAVKVRQFESNDRYEIEKRFFKIGDICIDHKDRLCIIQYDDIKGFYYIEKATDFDLQYSFAECCDDFDIICNKYSDYSVFKDYKGNILDEYLDGKNELAKMCGFND